MNYWPLICLAVTVIAAVLGFGAGAATGATFNGLDFKDVFIPMFSALGGWVSGAGALAAVGTTIYFYKKQDEENEEELEVTVYSRYGNVRVDILCLSRLNRPRFSRRFECLLLAHCQRLSRRYFLRRATGNCWPTFAGHDGQKLSQIARSAM